MFYETASCGERERWSRLIWTERQIEREEIREKKASERKSARWRQTKTKRHRFRESIEDRKN